MVSSLTQERSRPSDTSQLPRHPLSCHHHGCRGAVRQSSCRSHALHVPQRAVACVAASARERLLSLSLFPHTRLPAWLPPKTAGCVSSPKPLFSRPVQGGTPGGHVADTELHGLKACAFSHSVIQHIFLPGCPGALWFGLLPQTPALTWAQGWAYPIRSVRALSQLRACGTYSDCVTNQPET